MNKPNINIKNQFEFFKKLVYQSKIVLSKTIQLAPKRSNTKWLTGQSNVHHQTINETIIFFIERSKRDSKYGIKLRCATLTDEPFFRFDSDGPAHRNNLPNIPLEEQSVTTPHFNSYQKDGKAIAYKNETLKKENEAKIIAEDINFGISLFCIETNSKLATGEFPTIVDQMPEIEFNEIQNINFDIINFK